MKINKLIAWLLAVSGFTGCETIGGGRVMYGTPHATFEVKGVVTDEAGEPVRDIKIVVTDGDKNRYDGELTVGITDGSGNYRMVGSWFGGSDLVVTTEDIDVDKNGGEFEAGVLELKVESGDYVGGEGWNRGSVTKTADLELTLKTETDDDSE